MAASPHFEQAVSDLRMFTPTASLQVEQMAGTVQAVLTVAKPPPTGMVLDS
jgi:hypothetical protein